MTEWTVEKTRAHNGDFTQLFPEARRITRRWIYYSGPTNSGKTWNAFRHLTESEKGVYLAPLRLMALEAYDRLTESGHVCTLKTGEERIEHENAPYIASTMEMVDLDTPVDVCIIDEAQLITDPQRGWAWSRALMGVQAETIIMTGSPDAVPLYKHLCERVGDIFELHELTRKSPLSLLEEPTEHYERGDAIIAFSRNDVLELKSLLESKNARVSVLYGALSPEIRRQEAADFTRGDTDILVATNVIGMGLNLPIKRVLFSTLIRYNGVENMILPYNEIRQIGGRAGRYGHHEGGSYGLTDPYGMMGKSLQKDFQRHLKEAYNNAQSPENTRPGLWIPWNDIAALSAEWKEKKKHNHSYLPALLGELYANNNDPDFKENDSEPVLDLADYLEDVVEEAGYEKGLLNLEARYKLLGMPINLRSQHDKNVVAEWLIALNNREVTYPSALNPSYIRNQAMAEQMLKLSIVYRWLSYRHPKYFPDYDACCAYQREIEDFITRCLKGKPAKKKRMSPSQKRAAQKRKRKQSK